MPISRILAAIPFLLIAFTAEVSAQDRCGTMILDAIQRQQSKRETPEAFEKWMSEKLAQRRLRTLQNDRTQGTNYVIPVVVHIIHNGEAVGSGTNLSDAQIQSQIDVLNNDFQRLNADATNTPAEFSLVAGAFSIQFVLAKQDPNGKATNGITRTRGSKTSWTLADNATLKAQSYWPAENYFNLWVVNLSDNGIIGYTQLPVSNIGGLDNSSNDRLTDGVIIHYRTFGSKQSGSFGLDSNFDLGRTTTHEVGHFFGLRHIWGDASCGNDFVADTPLHPDSNNGCPSYPAVSTCTGHPNMMTMNYMDYTNDACMNMFSQGQIDRMTIVLENSPRRASLLTSPGATAPVAHPIDARIRKILSPHFFSCASTQAPSVRVHNAGITTITGGTARAIVDGQQLADVKFDLAPGDSTDLTFSTVDFVAGTSVKVVFQTIVTGDDNPLNDKDSVTTHVPSAVTMPFTQTFNVLPANWTVVNPDGLTTWTTRSTSSPAPNDKAIYVNYNQYEEFGSADHLVTPRLTSSDAATLRFNVSYAQYSSAYQETLMVSVISGCDKDLTDTVQIYKKSGSTLATSSNTPSDYIPSSASQWRTEVVALDPALTSSPYLIVFTGVGDYGNNLYLANVQVSGADIDLGIEKWIAPALVTCETNAKPSFQVRNVGGVDIQSFDATLKVNDNTYGAQVTGLSLQPGSSLGVELPAIPLSEGRNDVSLQITSVNGAGPDVNATNDNVVTTVIQNANSDRLPLRENFDGAQTWVLAGAGTDLSWVQSTANYGNSAMYQAFGTTSNGKTASLVSPTLDLSRALRASMFFDISYAVSDVQKIEHLRVLASTDCGHTFDQVLLDAPVNQLTNKVSNTAWTPQTSSDWSRRFVSLDALAGKSSARIALEVTGNGGNNVWVDNLEFFLNDDDTPLSVDPGIALYPGTTTSEVKLTFNLDTRQAAALKVYSSTGQLVVDNSFTDVLNQTFTVDFADQPAGIYIFRIQTGNLLLARKVLIRH